MTEPTSIFTNNYETIATINSNAPQYLKFACGIKINLTTGEVDIPETLNLSDAAIEFWKAVSYLCPTKPVGFV